MAETFSRVREDSRREWLYLFIVRTMEYMSYPAFPPPFNVVYNLVLACRNSYRRKCGAPGRASCCSRIVLCNIGVLRERIFEAVEFCRDVKDDMFFAKGPSKRQEPLSPLFTDKLVMVRERRAQTLAAHWFVGKREKFEGSKN